MCLLLPSYLDKKHALCLARPLLSTLDTYIAYGQRL